MQRFYFIRSTMHPEITARIEAKLAKRRKVTLIAVPVFSDSKKQCPNAKPIRRTFSAHDVETGKQTMVQLVERFYNENEVSITAVRVIEHLRKKPPPRSKEKVKGVFSNAYYLVQLS